MLSSLGGDVLPPDWEATTDPSSGNTYYYNTKTNAVSWERPRPAVPPPPGGAPSGGPPPDDLLGFDAPGRRGEYLVAVYGREERANFLAIAEAKPRPERTARRRLLLRVAARSSSSVAERPL